MEFTNLEIKAANCCLDLIAVSENKIKLSISLFDVDISVFNSVIETSDPILKVAFFLVENLDSESLVIAFLLLLSQIVLSLELKLLLSLANIVSVVCLVVKLLDVSSE